MDKAVTIDAVLTAQAVPFGPNGEPSAIDKQPLSAAVEVGTLGLSGDEQGNLRSHGGPEKAVHHYPIDHYPAWRTDHPEMAARLARPGAFGENISTAGMTEASVCVGDVYRLGSALVQVSQARQPCWRLNVRFQNKAMAKLVQASGRTGWYYRVIEGGRVAPGDEIALVERPHPDWPLARILEVLYVDTLNLEALRGLADLAPLAESWRTLAARRLEKREIESWERRLTTPARA